MIRDLPRLEISPTFNVEEAKMVMAGRPRETLMGTGDSRAIISLRYKTSNKTHLSEISLNPKIPMPTVSSLAIEFEDP